MKYLDLAAGQEVEVWERMEPQPEPTPDHFISGNAAKGIWLPASRSGKLGIFSLSYVTAPHPPGTRARVREPLKWVDNGGDPVERGHVYAASPEQWVEELVDETPLPRWVDIEASAMPDWAIRMDAISTTTRPEQRDGAWGFVTGWVQDEGVK